MFEFLDASSEDITPIVLGIGSVGCKIVDSMFNDNGLQDRDVRRIYVHSSYEMIKKYTASHSESILIRDHAHFLEKEIVNKLEGADVVFLVSGLGGETGSQISPYIAKIAKQIGVLCIGLFSFPFGFEGRSKIIRSQKSYLSLLEHTDSLVCIENDRFLESNLKNKSLNDVSDLFHDSNNHFRALIKGMLELVTRPGLINIELHDIKTIIKNMGLSTVGYSFQDGDARAELAVRKLLKSPALQNHDISKARGILVNITAGMDMTIEDFEIVGNVIKDFASEHALIVVGTVIDPDLSNKIGVTIIITGLPELPIDKDIEKDEFDIVTLSKSISFEPHQASAGLSILSYFNEFLHQKYSGVEAKVSIEQSGNKVLLIVETPSGNVEKIEKSISEFGLAVIGEKSPNDILESSIHVEKLKMKLEMAAMELKFNDRMLMLYKEKNNDYKARVSSLENQMHSLQQVICQSLTKSQDYISLQLSNYNDLPRELILLLHDNLNKDISTETYHHIKDEIEKHITDNQKAITLKKLAENVFYGVAGNSMYQLIVSILSTLPK
ncbi:cell division protein FtsZ [Aeromonas veronii]|uniref:cell division protein FtsZ n=1 Tax=Aeromonas veronii TaxID=654 RepID=UPI001E4B3074|nr:cell division protein FtsZ [Aeromonas veronii]MCD6617839.1 cell division FtsZ family protein [Aeromonas veronii]